MLTAILAVMLAFTAPNIPPEEVQYGVCPDGRMIVRAYYDLNFPSNDWELITTGESIDNPAYAAFVENAKLVRLEVYATSETFTNEEAMAAKYPKPCDVPQGVKLPESKM